MTFVFASIDGTSRPEWFVDVNTASFEFIDRCRERGTTAYVTNLIRRGADPQIEAVAKVRSKQFFQPPAYRYMNAVGGCCVPVKIYKTMECDDFPLIGFTVSDCRKFQWPRGRHWYAKTPDGRDIEWLGDYKWNSRESAIKAATKYLEEKCREK